MRGIKETSVIRERVKLLMASPPVEVDKKAESKVRAKGSTLSWLMQGSARLLDRLLQRRATTAEPKPESAVSAQEHKAKAVEEESVPAKLSARQVNQGKLQADTPAGKAIADIRKNIGL